MTDIRLYINDILADLNSESLISLTFALDDTDNPTIVKNSFSKSITLPSTKNNDRIFGCMHDITSRIVPDDGFSPLVRTPFKLYADGELIERGYVQLKEIATTKGVSKYKVDLFGGLGDFFYSLMYDADGNKRTLADLDYGIEGATDVESEMDFSITKEAVNSSWNDLGGGRNGLGEAITFVPAYNGVSDDIDCNHALVNTNGINVTLPRSYSDNGKTYMPYNGFGLVEFPKALNEWEVNDLRSYLQRPALSVRTLFNALKNPSNNGGYDVVLDPLFFNEENTLYHDAYITLPMMQGADENAEAQEGVLLLASTSLGDKSVVDIRADYYTLQTASPSSTVKVTIPVSLELFPSNTRSPQLYDCATFSRMADFGSGDGPWMETNSAVLVQVRVNDDQGNNIYSPVHIFSRYPNKFKASDGTPLTMQSDEVRVSGRYERGEVGYAFRDNEGSNTFPIEVAMLKRNATALRVTLRFQRVFDSKTPTALKNAQYFYASGDTDAETTEEAAAMGAEYASPVHIKTSDSKVSQIAEGLPTISSGTKITKQLLLSTDATPADYLLSYAKLFGLRFKRDKYDKKITITHNYFSGEVYDISDRIDWSDVSIKPNVFDKRIMRLALNTPETYYARKYEKTHGVPYAQKRVDTGFGFNAEVEEIYDNDIFTSAIPCRAVSTLYYKHRNSGGKVVPSIFSLDTKYILATGEGTTSAEQLGTYGATLLSSRVMVANQATPYYAVKGYDAMPKMCYFDKPEDVHERVDVANNLVVWCGNVAVNDANGEAIDYWLTDDLPDMIKLNGKICYLITQDEEDIAAHPVAIKRNTLPQFLSVRLMGNKVYDSFEFAKSKENYLGADVDYPEGVTLYNRYWQDFYTDRMDVNTRIVECKVNLQGLKVDVDINRHFYFFDNAYWLLNRVSDYNPASSALVKCQFIKVKNKDTYKAEE